MGSYGRHEQRLGRSQTAASVGAGATGLVPSAHRSLDRRPAGNGQRLSQSGRHCGARSRRTAAGLAPKTGHHAGGVHRLDAKTGNFRWGVHRRQPAKTGHQRGGVHRPRRGPSTRPFAECERVRAVPGTQPDESQNGYTDIQLRGPHSIEPTAEHRFEITFTESDFSIRVDDVSRCFAVDELPKLLGPGLIRFQAHLAWMGISHVRLEAV